MLCPSQSLADNIYKKKKKKKLEESFKVFWHAAYTESTW